VLLLYKPLKGK